MSQYDTILSNLQAVLPDLDSTSGASILVKIASALAPINDNTLTEISNSESIINTALTTKNYGDAAYYVGWAKLYEPGVDLIKDANLQWVYANPNPSLQLITQAALDVTQNIDDTVETLTLKLATLDSGTGLLRALTDISPSYELSGAKTYMRLYQIPGIPLSIISLDPNILKTQIEISFFNNYDLITIQQNVILSLKSFRDSFNFNGVLYLNDIISFLKTNVPGIRDIYIHAFSMVGVTFVNDMAILPAGYFNYDMSLTSQTVGDISILPGQTAGVGNITVTSSSTSGSNVTAGSVVIGQTIYDKNQNFIGVIATTPTTTTFTLKANSPVSYTGEFIINNINYIAVNANI